MSITTLLPDEILEKINSFLGYGNYLFFRLDSGKIYLFRGRRKYFNIRLTHHFQNLVRTKIIYDFFGVYNATVKFRNGTILTMVDNQKLYENDQKENSYEFSTCTYQLFISWKLPDNVEVSECRCSHHF